MLLIKTAKETQLRVAASLEEAQRQRPRTTELQALSAASGAYPNTSKTLVSADSKRLDLGH